MKICNELLENYKLKKIINIENINIYLLKTKNKNNISGIALLKDLIDKDDSTMKRMKEDIHYEFSATRHYPILFTSVKNNLRLQQILESALNVYKRLTAKVSTPLLNEIMQKIVNNNPPPAVKGKHLKIKYSAQMRHSPPIFAIFMNYPDLVPISYKRYIENQLRNELDLEGVPVKISFRKK